MIQVLSIHNIFGVDRSYSQFVVCGMAAAVIEVSVFHDLAHILWKLFNRSRNLNGQKIRITPCVDPRLSTQSLEQAFFVRDMRRNGYALLLSNLRENFSEVIFRQIRGRRSSGNTKITEKPTELFIVYRRGVDAKNVNTF